MRLEGRVARIDFQESQRLAHLLIQTGFVGIPFESLQLIGRFVRKSKWENPTQSPSCCGK